MTGPGQRMFKCADNQAAHHARIAKTHFGLARMDVNVNITRAKFKE